VDSSLTNAKGGTGLGLAVAKEIVEMHGGRILGRVYPRQGLDLPIGAPDSRRVSKDRLLSGRILVVAD